MGPDSAFDEHCPSRTGHGEQLWWRCIAIEDERTVALVGKDRFVGDRPPPELVDIRRQPRRGELAGVVFEQTDNLAIDEVKGKTVEIANVGYQCAGRCLDTRIF